MNILKLVTIKNNYRSIDIFNNIQNFGRIHSTLYYTESYEKLHKSLTSEASLFAIDYIFLEPKEQLKLNLPSLKKNDTLGNYRVIDKTDDIAVLHRIK